MAAIGRLATSHDAHSEILPHFEKAKLPILALLEVQGEIIDLMAGGASLRETLSHIALLVERLAPPALCSILLLKADGLHLRPAAGPSLPRPFFEAIDGIEIGPCAGSCGTAAFRKTPVIVRDIANDPLWAGPRDFVLSFGLRACWSLPILDKNEAVLGTIAMYYREPRAPTSRDWGLLEPASRLVRLALAQNRKEEELRNSEARWHLAAEATDLGTYDVDLATGHDIWSPQFKTILGLPDSTKPSVQLLLELIHADDRARFSATFGGPFSPTADTQRNEEVRIRRVSDGVERVVTLKGRILRNADGLPSRAIGTMADITEQRRRETELAEAKVLADKANKAKSEFLASMSHELRTPLNAIIGFSDVIRHETFGALRPAKYREYVDDIHDSGRHLLSLINDVLDMAKIEAGKLELNPVDLDIAATATNALRMVETQATEAGLAMDSRVDGGVRLLADERAVKQIFVNLLSNAVKFTRRGGRVTVFAERAADGKGVRLGVEDTGIGMTRDGLTKALQPFGQVAHTVTVEGRGTGLGLPLVKALIEAHGATFGIESAPGRGTRVWGEFPPDADAQVSLPA
ncbi:MAG: ATP-binding protein [Rhizomicrobium sp.]